ncbi:MAG: flagellar hook-length control protein FliK [Negativicutes bacterium]|nr:flagellar hook-length control protein FliK [Negativicutes bacterium]
MTLKTGQVGNLADLLKSGLGKTMATAGNGGRFADHLQKTGLGQAEQSVNRTTGDTGDIRQSILPAGRATVDPADHGTAGDGTAGGVGQDPAAATGVQHDYSGKAESGVRPDGEQRVAGEQAVKSGGGASGGHRASGQADNLAAGQTVSPVEALVQILAEMGTRQSAVTNGRKRVAGGGGDAADAGQRLSIGQGKLIQLISQSGLSQDEKLRLTGAVTEFGRFWSRDGAKVGGGHDGQLPLNRNLADNGVLAAVAGDVLTRLNKLVSGAKSGAVVQDKLDPRLQQLVEVMTKVNAQVLSMNVQARQPSDRGLDLLAKKGEGQAVLLDRTARGKTGPGFGDMEKLAAMVERAGQLSGPASGVGGTAAVAAGGQKDLAQRGEPGRIREIQTGPQPLIGEPAGPGRGSQAGRPEMVTVPRTVDYQDVFQQAVERMRLMTRSGQSEMVLRLNPESLGELTLKVVVRDGVLTAVFRSEQTEVRQVLEANLQQLRQELQQAGVRVENVEISSNLADDFTRHPGQGENRQAGTGNQERVAARVPGEDDTGEAPPTINELEGKHDYRV